MQSIIGFLLLHPSTIKFGFSSFTSHVHFSMSALALNTTDFINFFAIFKFLLNIRNFEGNVSLFHSISL